MRLTSLNIQGFDNWDDRKESIIRYINQEDPDVIFFQEVVYIPELSPFTPVELLNQSLEYPYQINSISRLQVGLQYPVYREGLSILSKYPIVKSDVLALKKDDNDEHNRILQLADLKVDDEIIKVGNIHFSITDNQDFATPQLQEVIEIVKSRQEKRILMGDFNLSDLQESAPIWQDSYLSSSVTPYVTYPSWHEGPKRVDYALIPTEYRYTSITTSEDGLSDHRALTISIEKSTH